MALRRAKTWTVTVPSHRRDCTMGADLVEEITRIHGLHKMEAQEPACLKTKAAHPQLDLQNKIRHARRALAGAGLSEAVTWSFVEGAHAKLFDGADGLDLDNPISPELSTMRPSCAHPPATRGPKKRR